jgi:hypothetical protein
LAGARGWPSLRKVQALDLHMTLDLRPGLFDSSTSCCPLSVIFLTWGQLFLLRVGDTDGFLGLVLH